MVNSFSKGVFVSQPNPIIGKDQWKLMDSDYDFKQEVARSAYADMLHDTDRNSKYYSAIKHTISLMKADGKQVNVLDIGTGSGLLSMMAEKCGADNIFACEAFIPLAKCAKGIFQDNNVLDKIKLIPKRSTDLLVGKDLPFKANLLVAELLDTELIGEGILETYKHAIENLLTDDAIFIPCEAKLYMQVVESPFLWSHHKLLSCPIDRPGDSQTVCSYVLPEMNECSGCPSVFDLQISELKITTDDPSFHNVRCLHRKPILIECFKFATPTETIKLEQNRRILTMENGEPLTPDVRAPAHAFVVWWRLQMEPTNTVSAISLAPHWHNNDVNNKDSIKSYIDVDSAWREHWMQAVYFPRQSVYLEPGHHFAIDYRRDAISMWFDFGLTGSDSDTLSCLPSRPVCECGLHVAWSRSRIAQLNTGEYRDAMDQLADVAVAKAQCALDKRTRGLSSVALVVLSDASLLPMLLADKLASQLLPKVPTSTVTMHHVDASVLSCGVLRRMYDSNSRYRAICLHDSVDSLLKEMLQSRTGDRAPGAVVLVSEPSAVSSILPWNPLYFWYAFAQLRCKLSSTVQELSCIQLVGPTALRIYAVAMQFRDLWKIRAPIGSDCEGFNLSRFDDLVQSAMNDADVPVEPQPLWEYPGVACSSATLVFELCLLRPPVIDDANSGQFSLPLDALTVTSGELILEAGECNGIALWAEWKMPLPDVGQMENGERSYWRASSGPAEPICVGKQVLWNRVGPHQGVFLAPSRLFSPINSMKSVAVNTVFDVNEGDPAFTFVPSW